MDELQHECGIAAIYHLKAPTQSPLLQTIAGTATTGPLGAAGPFTAVAEPQATYRWCNTCNR